MGDILRRNCLLKQVIEGKIEVRGRRGRRRKQLLGEFKVNGRVLETESGSARSFPVENSLGKRIRTSHKTVYMVVNGIRIYIRKASRK